MVGEGLSMSFCRSIRWRLAFCGRVGPPTSLHSTLRRCKASAPLSLTLCAAGVGTGCGVIRYAGIEHRSGQRWKGRRDSLQRITTKAIVRSLDVLLGSPTSWISPRISPSPIFCRALMSWRAFLWERGGVDVAGSGVDG